MMSMFDGFRNFLTPKDREGKTDSNAAGLNRMAIFGILLLVAMGIWIIIAGFR